VPARAGSKRVPNKNRREFLGSPLIQWTIDFALSIPWFNRVVVSTDSPEIAALARSSGAIVPWLRHPSLSSDMSAVVDVVLDLIERLEAVGECFDRVALLQPTSPVRFIERWEEAQRHMNQGASAVVGVRPAVDHPHWTFFLSSDGMLESCNLGALETRSQDLPPAYVPNGSLYLISVDTLRATSKFAPPGSFAVICGQPVESIDIDTEEDWLEAERLVSVWRSRF